MIFVDTSFWVAIRNRRDAKHEQAQQLLRRYADAALVTFNQIRGGDVDVLEAASRSCQRRRLSGRH